MPTYRARVTYWHSSPPRGSRIRVLNYTLDLQSRTESAILAALRKKHPGEEVTIQEYKWK